MQRLSKRLQAVADLLTAPIYDCVADVGTDHGYLPIYLTERGLCKKAIAMDINEGPLGRARAHILESDLEAYIETRRSDGLLALEKGEAQAVVIAGMGGNTMKEILRGGDGILEPDTVLVLQPQSEIRDFRAYLAGQGFRFLAEDMVFEDGKYYPMMKVRKSCPDGRAEAPAGEFTETELRYGPLLLGQRHPVLREFLLWQREQKERILENLRRAEGSYGAGPSQQMVSGGGNEVQETAFQDLDSRQEEAARRRGLRMAQLQEELGYICEALRQYEDVNGQ